MANTLLLETLGLTGVYGILGWRFLLVPARRRVQATVPAQVRRQLPQARHLTLVPQPQR